MSSTSPLLGRLCKIFTPLTCIAAAGLIFTLGTTFSALAPSFGTFLAARAVTGLGGAGIVACSIIIVLDLAPEERRGIFLGLINSGFTIGVSLGAVVAGAMVASAGWVRRTAYWTTAVMVGLMKTQRVFFLAQAPFSAATALAVLFAIPKSRRPLQDSIWQQLRRIDYLGVVTLVCKTSVEIECR